jgi:hypothetical protein
MTADTDQFTGSETEYDTLVNQIYTEIEGLTAPGIGVPAATMTAYDALLAPYNASWLIAKNKANCTKTQHADYLTKRGNLTDFLRPFVKMWLYDNTLATDAIITATGMRLHSDTRTSHAGAPSEIPVMEVTAAAAHTIDVSIHTSTGNIGKPVGVHSTRVRYFIGATPPAEPADYPKFQDFTKNPMALVLPAANAGEEITIAACYVSETGSVEGRYCNEVTLNVP